MKKFVCCAALILIAFISMTGCGKQQIEVASAAVSETPPVSEPAVKTQAPDLCPSPTATAAMTSQPTATPDVQATQKPAATPQSDIYVIDGNSIYRQSGGENILVYTVTPYLPSGWNCCLNNLTMVGGDVYFTEGGMPGDDDTEAVYRIIRIDRAGRTVLHETQVVGYTQLMVYADMLFFVEDGFDSQVIGWANMDGSGADWLDFSEYAVLHSVEPYYNGATLYMKDKMLYADVMFYTGSDPEIVTHTVCIGEDLSIERVK